MKLSLVVLAAGKQQGKVLEIKLPQFLVGRDPQCHLRPASPLISKRHCVILQRDGKVFVRDFGSTNGTFVNNEPVKGEQELHHDDQLKIGPLLFTVHLETTPSVSRPTPAPPTKAVRPSAAQNSTPAPPTKPSAAGAAKTAAEAPAPSPADTAAAPSPAAKAEAPAESAPDSDEDIAAMLLSLQDDGSAGPLSAGAEVPEGSTVMDLPAPGTPEEQAKADKEKEKAKPAVGNTSMAAKSILEKYMRRPRT